MDPYPLPLAGLCLAACLVEFAPAVELARQPGIASAQLSHVILRRNIRSAAEPLQILSTGSS